MKTSLRNLVFFGLKQTKNSPQTVCQKNGTNEQSSIGCFKITAVLFILFNLFSIDNVSAQKTWDGGASNDNWSDPVNWNANVAPVSTDNIVIPAGFTVYYDAGVSVASLSVSGTLNMGSQTTNVNTNRTLTVTGAVTINSGGTITSTGNGGNLIIIGGNLTNAGTFTDNAADLDTTFNGTNQTISGAGSYLFNAITFSGGGTKTLSSNITVSSNWTNNGGTFAGTGTVTIDGASDIDGTASTAFPNLTVGANVVQYVSNSVTGNFSLTSGYYAVSVDGNLTFNVGGNFAVSGGTFYLIGDAASTGATVTVTGNVTFSSTGKLNMEYESSSGVAVFNALANFTSTGTSVASSGSDGVVDFGTGTITNNAINIGGNFAKSGAGTFGTSATGTALGFVFNKSGTQTFSYAGAASDYTSYIVSSTSTLQLLTGLTLSALGSPSSSFTVNGTLDASTFTIGGGATNGSFILASGATLTSANTNGIVSSTSGTVSNTVGTRNFSPAANYNFTGSANQNANFGVTTINNLTISNTAGSVTLNAAITASGNVLINTGASLTAGNLTHNIAGNWTRNGTFVQGASTINLNGALSQTIGGSSTTFNNLTLANSTKVFAVSTVVNGNLTIAPTAVANLGSITSHTAGTLTLGTLGTAAASKFGSTSTSGTSPVYKNNTFFTAGTTGYVTTGATSSCTAPTITFTAVPSVCQGALSASIPYSATTGSPDLYSLSGTGITSVVNGSLSAAPSSITVNFSTGATPPSVTASAFTVSSSVTGCVSNNLSGSVTVLPVVGTPSFTAGLTTVCQDAADTTYTASATNTTGITYSVLPVTAGTINSASGVMNWSATFSGTATITASAAGCSGPTTADRVVTVTPSVTTPVFSAGATTVCQDAADETYTASASNTTGITYSVLPVGAGTIGSTSGVMNWSSTFSGSATITATASGCGPKTADRVVSVTGTVATPAFTVGATSVCQGTASTTYTATATNSTSITYSVLPAGAGSIGSTSGVMSWNSGFFGTATITASAAGCGGPKTADRVVTVSQPVTTPTFSTAPTSLCQDAADTTYTAIATNSTGITYTVSPAGAGTINSGNGLMNWNASFSGNATITASAAGCGGPKTVNVVVNIIPSVATPGFTAGDTEVCQDSANETYTATAANNTGITYSISSAAAGTINPSTGEVDWNPNFSGNVNITATATGCNGPKAANRSVTVRATVGTPTFSVGPTSVCQNASTSTYIASASDSDSITYSVSPAAAGTMTNFGFGFMDWSSTFSGTATITATATGCNGPKTATRVVIVTPTVGTPVFTVGANTVCQDAANELYTASATDATSISYSVAPSGAGTIGSSTGIIDWNPAFTGNATITASAAGCNGPKTATKIVTVTPSVTTPSFTAGLTSVCQDASNTTYTATATNSTGITYSVSPSGAGTIGSSTGIMDWDATFSGTATITASAAGCNGPLTAQRVVNVRAKANAGADGTVVICAGSTVTLAQLNAAIIGEDLGGTWSPTLAGAGTYTYTVAATSPCSSPDTSIVIVTEQAGANAGADGVYTICAGTEITLAQLNAAITGEDTGGIWSPALAGAGTYTYTVAATSPCSTPDTSVVVVSAVSCQPAELSHCGNVPVLTSVNARIFVANSVTQATKYRYRVAVSNAPTNYFYAETIYPSFRLTDVVGLTPAYGTTYTVEIQNEFLLGGNTVASAYGTLCTVTTQAANDISIAANQCGQTLAAVNSKIYVNSVIGATMYTYRIAKQSAPTTYSYIETPYPNFRLTNPPTSGSVAIEHNTIYIVAVSVATPNGVSDFNSPCLITTPAGPVTTIQGSQCGDDDNPYVIPTSSTKVYAANFVSGATYTFKLEQYNGNVLVDTNEATSPINYFNTNMFTGENSLLPDTKYHVYVRINSYGEGEFDHDCVLKTPIGLKHEEVTTEFKAFAYPNPFANNFMIDVKSASESAVSLKVYDMLGRLIDQREVKMSDLETTEIGNNYPSGVYNVVISQENSTQTVRVVKR